MIRPLIHALALAVLVPVMIGPLPARARTITTQLCNGGSLTIPLGKDAPADDDAPCHPKGCHAGTCREKDAPIRPKRTI